MAGPDLLARKVPYLSCPGWVTNGLHARRLRLATFNQNITLWLFNIAMENHHFFWEAIYLWAIFHGYVKKPEGNFKKRNSRTYQI
jgi:hypothetical protein